ncbi:Hypothetical protein FSTVST1_306 [Faustovirus ST1]|nr:Hypothetical protein FSTVST1_306 [Faustovirus ST1]
MVDKRIADMCEKLDEVMSRFNSTNNTLMQTENQSELSELSALSELSDSTDDTGYSWDLEHNQNETLPTSYMLDAINRDNTVKLILRHVDKNWLNVLAANTSGLMWLYSDVIIDTDNIYSYENISDNISNIIAEIAKKEIAVDNHNELKKYSRYIQWCIELSARMAQFNAIKTIFNAVSIYHPEVIKKNSLYKYTPTFSLRYAIVNAVLSGNTELAEWLALQSTDKEQTMDFDYNLINISCNSSVVFNDMALNDINYKDYITSSGYYYAIMSKDIELLNTVSTSIFSTVKRKSMVSVINLLKSLTPDEVNDINIGINLPNVDISNKEYEINFPFAYALAIKYGNSEIREYILNDASFHTMSNNEVCVFNDNVFKHLITSLNDIDASIDYLETIDDITRGYVAAYITLLRCIERYQRYDLLDRVSNLFAGIRLELFIYVSILTNSNKQISQFLLNNNPITLPRRMRLIADCCRDEYCKELFLNATGEDSASSNEFINMYLHGYNLAKNNFAGEELDDIVVKIFSIEMIAQKSFDVFKEFCETRRVKLGKAHFSIAVFYNNIEVLDYLFTKVPHKAPMHLPLTPHISSQLDQLTLSKNKQMMKRLFYHNIPIILGNSSLNFNELFID